MKTGFITILFLTCLLTKPFYGFGCMQHSKQTDGLLNLIQKTAHNDLEQMSCFANKLLQSSKNKQDRFYGEYYLVKARYYTHSMKETAAQLDSLYETISQKKYNHIKYEIDLLISDYYFGQDNFEAGLKRLEKIRGYGNEVDFKVAAYILPAYSYLNSERAIEYIEKNIHYCKGKFANTNYLKEWLKTGLLRLQFKYKSKVNFENTYLQNIETCKKNGWIDLAIENIHSLIYVYEQNKEDQLKAIKYCKEAIDLAKQLGSTHLLSKLYHTKGHVYLNLSGFYYPDISKLQNKKELDQLKVKQLKYFDAAYQSYEQALCYAQIQQNNNRVSRLYSALGALKVTIDTIVKKEGVLEEVCVLYNCALTEMGSSNFEAMRILKARINLAAIHFGAQPSLNEISREIVRIDNNKHLRKTEMSVAKTDFERTLFQDQNMLNIEHVNSQNLRNTLIVFVPLLLLSLVYYYRQKYLMLKQIEKQSILIKTQNRSLRQAVRRLERANRGLENFAFTAAHDIKSPLRSIASFTGLLKRKYFNPESEDNVLFFDYVIKGCEDLSYFVDNLLKFSTILHKNAPAKKIDLNGELTKIRHRLKRTLEEEKICLQIEESLPVLQAHGSLIYQLFYNLIANSIKFKKHDVHTFIEVGCILEDEEALFYVKDNGIGIEVEKQNEVFDLFNKLYANTEYDGFGIGLATCKKIVHYYKGKLWLQSTVGEETTVYFSLPDALTLSKLTSHKIQKSLKNDLVSA